MLWPGTLTCARFDTTQRTYEEARQFCSSPDSKLVEIDSIEENTALMEEMEKLGYVEEKRNFWLGLTDKLSEGNFVLESTGEAPSFLNWANNEPNNYKNEDCAEIMAGGFGTGWRGKWNDIWCWYRLGTICEARDGGKAVHVSWAQ